VKTGGVKTDNNTTMNKKMEPGRNR